FARAADIYFVRLQRNSVSCVSAPSVRPAWRTCGANRSTTRLINPRARPCDEQVIQSARGAVDCAARQRRWVLVATVLASVISYIDESVVNIALPAIAKDLAVQVAAIQWVINAYTLSLSSFLLIGGAAGDQFGRRRIFIVGITIFAVASVCCGLASNIELLIAARAVQGIGAALLIPCSLAIIGASFPE